MDGVRAQVVLTPVRTESNRINKKLRLPDEISFIFCLHLRTYLCFKIFFSEPQILKDPEKDDKQADAAFLEAFIRHTMEEQEHFRHVYADSDTDRHDSTSRQIFW